MSTEIYYFSGTGNSLAVARDLAGKLDGRLVSIASLSNRQRITPGAGALGLVFPVYHGGLPLIVQRFVSTLAELENRYIFAVCTYGDAPGLAISYLADLISQGGGKLASGWAVHMPYNYLTPVVFAQEFEVAFTLRRIAPEIQQSLFDSWQHKMESIAGAVASRQSGVYETSDERLNHLIDRMHLKETLGKKLWLKLARLSGR